MRRPSSSVVWLGASIAFALWCAARSMLSAFLDPAVIQDDARQHVFWMLRWADPSLFPNDPIADYFTSLAPPAYSLVYRVLGLATDPLTSSKILPPLLGAIGAAFVYLLARRLHPSPVSAFAASILASWYVWQHDDVASAGPRSFLWPMLAAALWAMASRGLWLAVTLAVVGTLTYPVIGALVVAVLGARCVRVTLFRAEDRRLGSWLAFAVAAVLSAAAALPSLVVDDRYGPTVSAAMARSWPEFGLGGRNAFFVPDPVQYWLVSYRSGFDLRVSDAMFPRVPLLAEMVGLAALLPLVLVAGRRGAPIQPPSASSLVLVDTAVASLALFFLAHATLFRLYLPARYVQWSIPLVLAVMAGLALGAPRWSRSPARTPLVASVALALGLGLYPAAYDGNFVPDLHPTITGYLRELPVDALVAAAAADADSIPSRTGRRILMSREYALAYHVGYHAEAHQRMRDLIDAYYTDTPGRLVELAERYGVTHFVVNRAAFDPATAGDAWSGEFEPYTSSVIAKVKRGTRFALRDLTPRCAAVNDGDIAILSASCIVAAR